jgi:glycosyltransferase involved in cell wall biosynthesis
VNPTDIFIVIPCYNDKRMIRETVQGLLPYKYSIVVVDDGSDQNVYEEIADLPVIYARHRINLGQGAALQTGAEIALARNAKLIVHFDSDGQHSVDDIPEMIRPLIEEKADIVIGSRFLNRNDTDAVPLKRRMLLRTARLVNWCLTGVWLSDAHNGFRAMTVVAGSRIKLKENRMGHASEILMLIRNQKLRFAERPTHIIYSEYSMAKGQSPLNAINIVIDILLNKIFK